ncbi:MULTISPECIES: VOC family protein [unclassified Curtobacterium]|uniref:VOC family protein n=1 Tax=unclassified Curtobacterium TaxID=257496 RepID=UPI001C650B0D|nr:MULTISPECIES: VOC family protein [unclassified Curtobacterium]
MDVAGSISTAPLSLNTIQIDAADPLALAWFWSAVLGVPVNPGSTTDSASLVTSNRIPSLVFTRTEEPKIWRNRISFRFVSDDTDAHLGRLFEMHVPFIRTAGGPSGTTTWEFLDPEGNEFTLSERSTLP